MPGHVIHNTAILRMSTRLQTHFTGLQLSFVYDRKINPFTFGLQGHTGVNFTELELLFGN
jgi:hypothetical protein